MPPPKPTIVVEFYGMPRRTAGMAELSIEASTVEEALVRVERICPRLGGLVGPQHRLSSLYLLSVNGQYFVDDLNQLLHSGERLLLLSADAGG